MPIVRILLILFALATPALAQDGARHAATAKEAAMDFRVYVDGVSRKGERPVLTRPDVAAMLGRVFDVDALSALPAVQGGDLGWLLDWTEAANTVNKLILLYGAKPGSKPDLATLQLNMIEYEDQYAMAMNFLIRGHARAAVAMKMFMADLKPEQRTRIREEGFTKARHGMAEFVLGTICSAVENAAANPENARLVSAAIRDTQDIWASSFTPQDRARVIAYVNSTNKQVADETARTDLVAFTAALQAVD